MKRYKINYNLPNLSNCKNEINFESIDSNIDQIHDEKQDSNCNCKLLYKTDKYFVFIDNNGYYHLKTQQSHMTSFHKDTYNNKFSYCKMFIEEIDKIKNRERILFLGFGLGGLPLKLSTYSNVKLIDCVEIDCSLYELFKKVIPTPSNKINYFCQDAIKFLECNGEPYDIIMDDLFMENKKIQYNYKLIYNKLKYGGYLYINVHWKKELDKIILELKNYFTNVTYRKDNEYLIIAQK